MQKIWFTCNLISPQIWESREWGRCPTYRKLNKYTQQTLHLNSLMANICCLSHICFIFKTGRWLEDNKLFSKIENGVQLARFNLIWRNFSKKMARVYIMMVFNYQMHVLLFAFADILNYLPQKKRKRKREKLSLHYKRLDI